MIDAVRKGFYALVCFFALAFASWAIYDVASYVLRRTVFTEANKFYSATRSEVEVVAAGKNKTVMDHDMLSRDIPMLFVNVPLFMWSYRKVRT